MLRARHAGRPSRGERSTTCAGFRPRSPRPAGRARPRACPARARRRRTRWCRAPCSAGSSDTSGSRRAVGDVTWSTTVSRVRSVTASRTAAVTSSSVRPERHMHRDHAGAGLAGPPFRRDADRAVGVVGEQDLVARREVEARQHRAGGRGRVAHEGQRLRFGAEELADLGAGLHERGRQLPHEEAHRVGLHARAPGLLLLEHRRRDRPERPVVEVRHGALERPERPDLGPVLAPELVGLGGLGGGLDTPGSLGVKFHLSRVRPDDGTNRHPGGSMRSRTIAMASGAAVLTAALIGGSVPNSRPPPHPVPRRKLPPPPRAPPPVPRPARSERRGPPRLRPTSLSTRPT